jgi:hypothetical protein
MLKDNSSDDQAWIHKQETINSLRNLQNTCTVASWQLVTDKYASVEHKMSNGDAWVVLEHYPNKQGKFTGIRFDKSQWFHLKSQFGVILDYVSAAETGKSWKVLAALNQHMFEENNNNFVKQQVRFLAVDNNNIYVTLKLSDPDNKSGCQVDIRRCFPPDNKHVNWMYLLEGLTLSGGTFHYLADYLSRKIEAALNMCQAMYRTGHSYYAVCSEEGYSTTENIASLDDEQDTSLINQEEEEEEEDEEESRMFV